MEQAPEAHQAHRVRLSVVLDLVHYSGGSYDALAWTRKGAGAEFGALPVMVEGLLDHLVRRVVVDCRGKY